ncbi:SWIM zinc finger family protein [Klebsiella aerogenes]|uniref:SWIM zinc finger family protein n=1 Tax=Klebsiella aerogenes TaxID=548 RepID=UPI00292CAD3E|nr:SWIM zinc finger family protein [Klebsiella aerogenes]
MTLVRAELLELTPQALTALSNAGFVKRSLKELDAGNIPELTQQSDGTLTAHFSDGIHTRLAQGQSLKQAICSCGASGMCRHRVMLVLSYQRANASANAGADESAQRWSPSLWLPELATLPDATRRRAQLLAAQGLTVELFCLPGEPPAAKLPMSDVRFYSRSSLRFARCDCVEGTLCEHVALAVQAFADAESRQPGFHHLMWQSHRQKSPPDGGPFATSQGEACRRALQRLVDILWQGGLSQPPISYDAAFSRAQKAAQSADWRWVESALAQLRSGIDAFQQRASDYHPASFLAQLAALDGRLRSAGWMAQLDRDKVVPPLPWRNIVGLGVAGESQLDHLRLISLGMRCWQDSQRYGLRIWYCDPDTGNILQLSRSWPLAERIQIPVWQRRIFSFQASALAGGQIISQAARRTANGELLLGSRQRLSSNVPLTADAWRLLAPPLRQPGVSALRQHLRDRPPACVRPLSQVDNLFILPVGECLALGWDASRQTLDAQVQSGDNNDDILHLSLPASASAPFAVEHMAALLQQQDDPVCLVSGLVSFNSGTLTLVPLTMITRTRAWALDGEASAVGPLPSAGLQPALSAAQSLLLRSQELLIQILHNGLRYQQQNLFREAQRLSGELANSGFQQLARLYRQLIENGTATTSETLNTIIHLSEQLAMKLD